MTEAIDERIAIMLEGNPGMTEDEARAIIFKDRAPKNPVTILADCLAGILQNKISTVPISNFPANEPGQVEALEHYCSAVLASVSGIGWRVYCDDDAVWSSEGSESIVFRLIDVMARARFDLRAVDPSEQKNALVFARALSSFRGSRAVSELAKRSPVFYRTPNSFDADPDLLNCKGIAVNLRTGETRKAESFDLFTMSTGCRPVAGPTPVFNEFMRQISCDRPDVVLWLMRFFGYALTGNMDTPFFVNFWGGGRNGKGALMRLMRFIFGSYAIEVAPSVVVDDGRTSGPRGDIVDLMGPRLGVVDEVPPGRLSIETVKRLTGGDSFRAARKYQDEIEFRPRIKLITVSQNRLELHRVDVAMTRRFRLVPFGYTIPEGQENPELERQLLTEAPAILARIIDEAREYLSDPAPRNFPKSETIDGASTEYIRDEDVILRWVEARCVKVGSEKSSILYRDFAEWANDEGIIHPMGPRTFDEELISKGFPRLHTSGGNYYQGLMRK